MDLLNAYGRASEWTLGRVAGTDGKLSSATPCVEWVVSELLNHMLDTQRFFVGTARSVDISPPSPTPPSLLGDDPVADFEQARSEIMSAFGEDGVIAKTGPSLGIAFSDQLLHGWDLAMATEQDGKMPDGLAEAAYEAIHGRFSDEERKGIFGPEIAIPAGASAQDKLLAYTGRSPSL